MDPLLGDGVRILYVDDNSDLVASAAGVLEQNNEAFAVETTTSPTDALAHLENGQSVDCVVSDYQMPEMDGLELLAAVREREPEIPFILFTGKGSEEIASEAISAGVTDYIQKESGAEQYTVLAKRIENAVSQRRAQGALERTKHRYQTLIRESSDVIAVVEPDWTVRYVSPAAEHVLACDPSECVGDSVFELVHPEDRDRMESAFDELLTDPTVEPTVQCRFPHGDGGWIRLEAEGRNLLADDVIEGIAIYARDVSEAVARETELERYEQIVEIAGDGAYVLDEEGNYEMVNRQTAVRTGYDVTELEGMSGSEVLGDEDTQRAREALYEVYHNDEEDFAQFEATVHARDGTEYPVEIRTAPIVEDDRIVGAVGLSRDIGERKERERELERYEKIVETAGDAAEVLDPDGRYVMINDTLVERTGYDREKVLGNTPEMLLDDEHYERALEHVRTVLGDPDRDYAEFEVTIETTDGERYPVEVRMAPIVEDGEFRGSVGISREITERKRRERELRRQNERLSEFAGVVSHDLRNPLNVARARAELAREEPEADHVEAIDDALERMERLIEDLLTLAREGRTVEDPEPFDVGEVAREAWAAVETDGASLSLRDGGTVTGDRARVRQVFENLFRNAIEHGGPGVTVTVGVLPDGGFYVEDDGVGLDGADAEDIFEPNYSTKSDGTGLGLSIVRDIVEAHGWQIRASDVAAGGARFEVRESGTEDVIED